MQIKVCHLTSVHPINDVRIFVKQCTSLAANGFDVTLIACGDTAYEDIQNGVKRISLNVPIKSRLQRMRKRSKAVLRKAIEIDSDIYHLHDPELIAIGLYLSKRGKIVIYDAHEDLPLQMLSKPYLNGLSRRIFSILTNLYLKYACSKLSAVVTATPKIESKFNTFTRKVVNINNFPILDEFSLVQHVWSSKSKQVCYIGGFSQTRGIKEIVSAMSLVQGEVRLSLGGCFNEPGFDSLVKSLPGWSSVDNLGFLDRAGVSKLLSNSYAGLVTLHPTQNYIDSLPVKMFEYMAAGLPVIASNFPLWKEIIEVHNCGICVDPTKPEEIANAIDLLVSNPELAREMGENGKRAVNEKFNWKSEEKKLIDLYESLLK